MDDKVLTDILSELQWLRRNCAVVREGVATDVDEASVGNSGIPIPVAPVRALVTDERVHLLTAGNSPPVAIPHEL